LAATKASKKSVSVPKITEETADITIVKEKLKSVAKELHEKENLHFEHLSFITAVDFGDYLELIYQFYSYKRKHSLTLRTRVLTKDLVIDSLTSIWKAADWQEREVYDLFGVKFKGHPNLKRILLAEDFPGHPLRKDFACKNDEEYILK